MKSSSSEEEGTAETCDELTKSQFPSPLTHCREGGREIENKAEHKKKGGVEERCFKDLFSH